MKEKARICLKSFISSDYLTFDDTDSIPALSILRSKLHETTTPERQDWHDALIVQWTRLRDNRFTLSLLTISESETSKLISECSEHLITTCFVSTRTVIG